MTLDEAIAEARRRWGARGCALLPRTPNGFHVGVDVGSGAPLAVRGSSAVSFEDAFRDADECQREAELRQLRAWGWWEWRGDRLYARAHCRVCGSLSRGVRMTRPWGRAYHDVLEQSARLDAAQPLVTERWAERCQHIREAGVEWHGWERPSGLWLAAGP